ncbi:YtxH domain-containing protein, partial [Staphylococcus aureus]|uniref:YtxH domain-containing protein n=1 Tax=Staphylococcus aureus TaxID=1280 RepID=UPI001EEF8FD6
MAKGNLFKAILGIGGAVAAVLVTRKDSRDKLKAEYNKYKQDPQSYKDNAKDKATQLGTIANETIKEVKTNPKEYANRLKNNPKAFFKEEKSKFTEYDNKNDESIEKGKFLSLILILLFPLYSSLSSPLSSPLSLSSSLLLSSPPL